eukprot:scaffold161988_cov34-Tisochrysis_lutea.AAC.8
MPLPLTWPSQIAGARTLWLPRYLTVHHACRRLKRARTSSRRMGGTCVAARSPPCHCPGDWLRLSDALG